MNFKPELVEKILAGQKTETRRQMSDNPRSPWYRGGCSLKPDHAYALCPGRGKTQVGKIVVLTTYKDRLGDVDGEAAKAEGFGSVLEFRDYWARLNGGLDLDEEVWVIEFFLCPPEDYPLWEGGK